MKVSIVPALLLALFIPSGVCADEAVSLEQQVENLSQQVQNLQRQLHALVGNGNQGTGPLSARESSDAPTLTTNLGEKAKADLVDLNLEETSSVNESTGGHVLSNPWWQNFHISGFAAAGLYDTGSAGTRNHGGFEIKEATLFIEGDIWENSGFFLELQTNRLGKDDQTFTRTGEAYLHFRRIPVGDNYSIGMKLGRIDIPFGEEYLWQDAIDTP